MSETLNVRQERIERLLRQLEYEVTRSGRHHAATKSCPLIPDMREDDMNVTQLPIHKCLQCGNRATRKLGLVDFDTNSRAEPKYYCEAHFPSPLDEDGLRLLLDKRDAEIERLRAYQDQRIKRQLKYMNRIGELDATVERLRAVIKSIDAQSIATTEPNYVAVPASIIADAVHACEQKADDNTRSTTAELQRSRLE